MRIFRQRNSGFTLMELMIVVAIVGILAAIAYPSYQKQLQKGRRADAQQYLMAITQANQRYFLDNRTYETIPGNLQAIPASVDLYYTITIVPISGPPLAFEAKAQPKSGPQASDACGTLSVFSTGARTSSSGTNCW